MLRFLFRAATAISALLLLCLLVAMPIAKPAAPTNLPVHPVQQRFSFAARPDGLSASISRPDHPKLFTLYIGGNMAGRDSSHYYKTTPQGTLILHDDGRAQTDKIDQGAYAGITWQSGAASPSASWEPPAAIQDQIKNRRDEFWPALALVPWYSVTVPYRYPLLLTSLLPALWLLAKLKRARRATQGRCIACGYDLRATPHQCPECGRPAATAPSPAPSTTPSTTPSTATSPSADP